MMIRLLGATALAALLHVSPTVVLVKRPDAAARLLPGAQSFAARELHLSEADAHRLHQTVDWSPDDGVLTFYLGRQGDQVTGVLMFVRVDTPHGPIEVAVGFGGDGRIREVLVTKATVETKPWVLDALRAGLADSYRGLKAGDTPAGADAVRSRAGALPVFMAGQVDKGVARALAAYAGFYTPRAE